MRAFREIYRIVDKAVDHAGLPKTAMISVLLKHEGEADEVVKGFPSGKVTLALDFSPRQRTYAVEPDFEETALKMMVACKNEQFTDLLRGKLRVQIKKNPNVPEWMPLSPKMATMFYSARA